MKMTEIKYFKPKKQTHCSFLLLELKTPNENTFAVSQIFNALLLFQYEIFISASFCLSDTEQSTNTNPSSLTSSYDNNSFLSF